MTEINRYNFILNSSCRTSGSNNAPVFNLHYNIATQNQFNYFTVECLNPVFPFSFDMVQTQNNTFNVQFVISGITYPVSTLSITKGNYNILQLMSAIQTALQTQYKTLSPSGTAVINVNFDSVHGLVDISISKGNETSVSMTFSQNANYILTMIGYTQAFSVSDTSAGVSDSHYNVCPLTQIYIRSSQLLSSNYEMTAGNTVQRYSNIIGIQNLNTSFDSYLINSTLYNLISKLSIKSIYEIDLFLTCDNANINVDFNGIPWSITLLIKEFEPTQAELKRQISEEYYNNMKQKVAQLQGSDVNLNEEPLHIYQEPDNQDVQENVQKEDKQLAQEIVEEPLNIAELDDAELEERLNQLAVYEEKLQTLMENAEEIGISKEQFKNIPIEEKENTPEDIANEDEKNLLEIEKND